jgi:hypothetical protein
MKHFILLSANSFFGLAAYIQDMWLKKTIGAIFILTWI